jgi:hypothetical protein
MGFLPRRHPPPWAYGLIIHSSLWVYKGLSESSNILVRLAKQLV